MDWSDEAYEVVKKIPKGRVATYGQIAQIVNGKWKLETGKSRITARMVGQALHKNPDPAKTPCHRVVDRNGKIAENFAFGGWREQRRRLVAEGVRFRDATHVDLDKSLWNE